MTDYSDTPVSYSRNNPAAHDHCPTHGDIIAIRDRCPWGECGTTFHRKPRAAPSVAHDLERAFEVTALFHAYPTPTEAA